MSLSKSTLADLARAARVSTATVDRVMNGRSNVSNRTRDHVLAIARRLGFRPPSSFVLNRTVQLDFILPGGSNTYLDLLASAFEEEGRDPFNALVRVHRIEGFSPDALCAKLEAIRDESHGIGIVALDHPKVREAVRDLHLAGIPVLAMVSDIPSIPRLGYVGIDNRAAGRLAGYLVGRFVSRAKGKVALFAGSLSYRGHEEREMGFRHILNEDFPKLSVLGLREIRDDWEQCYRETLELLKLHSDLIGIYNIGAGNRGIARALEESGRSGEIVFVGHELTAHTRRFLLSGVMDAVIDQHPRLESREAINALARAARGLPTDNSSIMIAMQVIFRDNIPLRDDVCAR
ncbi:MAG: LacI family DNA-binding transcriptional regulator [Verrucomicrobia bacterium]|nr:LacI family DNA-binding transcriptional regulator [Verrucomicrobiota bacterium]